jgi:hypothetical protein
MNSHLSEPPAKQSGVINQSQILRLISRGQTGKFLENGRISAFSVGRKLQTVPVSRLAFSQLSTSSAFLSGGNTG